MEYRLDDATMEEVSQVFIEVDRLEMQEKIGKGAICASRQTMFLYTFRRNSLEVF